MSSWPLPTKVLSHARRLSAAVEQHVERLGRQIHVDAAELITGRAALLGLDPPTRISSGGSARLLQAADGWLAVTLSRADDVEAVPALLELPDVPDPWEALETAAATRPAADVVDRARLLDIPAAVLGEVAAGEPTVVRHNPPSARPISELLVVDLSPMWAGPLCGRILADAGATVVKVEAPRRPDGTRGGNRGFFDWMNSGKLCYSKDFAPLLRAADVVIEASRPAVLVRRGLAAEQVPARPGRVWLRISGYGRAHPDRVAFGDDAAVAGGLVMDGPVFCGDAIADPLSGLVATAAVFDALAAGGGVIIDVSIAGIAATYAGLPDRGIEEYEPRRPELPAQPAHELGADNDRVRELIEARLVAC